MLTAVAADEPEEAPPGWQLYLDYCQRNWDRWLRQEECPPGRTWTASWIEITNRSTPLEG